MNLTPWFPGHTKPARAGVYERGYRWRATTLFCRWDGKRWYGPKLVASLADQEMLVSTCQDLPWRGLAADPNPPSEVNSQPDPVLKLAGLTEPKPIDMVLFCPACGMQHIDAPEGNSMPDYDPRYKWAPPWTNPPHRSHLCHGCGHIWRPADVPTNGVAATKTRGQNDSPTILHRAFNLPVEVTNS